MGLNMVVGVLADIEDAGEDDYADMVRSDFTVIRELLDLAGAGPWDEPELDEEEAESFEMWGYSGLHTVRRLAWGSPTTRRDRTHTAEGPTQGMLAGLAGRPHLYQFDLGQGDRIAAVVDRSAGSRDDPGPSAGLLSRLLSPIGHL